MVKGRAAMQHPNFDLDNVAHALGLSRRYVQQLREDFRDIV